MFIKGILVLYREIIILFAEYVLTVFNCKNYKRWSQWNFETWQQNDKWIKGILNCGENSTNSHDKIKTTLMF